ncbi:MAG: hypothetical protein QOF12_33, partial [Solirubrobacteraceae bacterium]|nr:hypothetical protein [Solirubrobacteraceae bacterium]
DEALNAIKRVRGSDLEVVESAGGPASGRHVAASGTP